MIVYKLYIYIYIWIYINESINITCYKYIDIKYIIKECIRMDCI